MTDAEHTSGIALLVDWANTQDHWVRALVGAVLETRRALSEEVTAAFFKLLLQEKGLEETEGPVSVAPIEARGDANDQEQALRLKKLSGVKNVNALAADQDIEFNAQMTVLYGENGAGKTGYVRILKQLASVRTAEAILPNIERRGASELGASIDYVIGESPQSYAWAGEEGVPPFTQIDVFDAQGVDLHVDGELTYVYTPGELAVFRHTHTAIGAVKSKLDKTRKETLPIGNPYLNKFSRDGALYAKIEILGETTDVTELERLGTVSESERAELAPLQERVDALRSGTSDAKLQLAEGEQELFQRLKAAIALADEFEPSEYVRRLQAVRTAEAAHTHATKEALAGETIPGVLEGTWRAFIEAGERYLEEHKSEGYPTEGDTCPYCLQHLGAAALAVVRKYRSFCQSDLQDALDKARTELSNHLADVSACELAQLANDIDKRLDALGEEGTDETLVAAVKFVAEFRALQETVAERGDLETSELTATIDLAQPLVEVRLGTLKPLVKGLRAETDDRKTLSATESARLRDLQDRITLAELLPGIRDHVFNAKWASRAKTIQGRFRSLGRSLTETAKLASRQLLNRDFQATFTKECKALRAPAVTLDFPGRDGQPARRKSLTPEYRLSAILSEGEQKVIALADFIAEATLRRSSTPLVLDDPVTSLDYKRLQHVVERLVELSATRQVVVFTHNIWFTMELLGRFDRNRKACTYYDVSEDGLDRGVVSPGESPRLDTWNDKKKRINVTFERAKTEDDKTMRDVLVEKAYDDLRGACEIVVEQDLLQAVVQSYRPNVMVGNLTRLNFDDLPAAAATVNEVFERCCRFTGAHKQPLETLNVRPSLAQLEVDWNALQAIHSQFAK